MRWGFPSQCSGGSGTGSTPCALRRDALGRASLVAPLGEASGPYIHFGPFRARVRANLRGAWDATPLQGKFGETPLIPQVIAVVVELNVGKLGRVDGCR